MVGGQERYGCLHEGDFGLGALAARLAAEGVAPDGARALELASEVAALCDGEGAVELGVDVGALLDCPLPDEVLRTAWRAAVHDRFDPAASGAGLRGWLRRLADLCPARPRATSSAPLRARRPEAELRRTVAAEIHAGARALEHAVARAPSPALPPAAVPEALAAVAREAGAGLGLRLWLRALKTYAVPVGKEQYDRLMDLDTELGYPGPVVYDGLTVRWPPIDTNRRDATGDFGLSELTSWFDSTWEEPTARERVRRAAAADDSAQTPGTAAALLLRDAERLLGSGLDADALAVLWLTASGDFDPARLGLDVREWLTLVADVSRERLREVAPAYTPGPAPVRADLRDDVLAVVRETAGQPAGALDAVAEVVARVDPDLGYRLFLRLLTVWCTPLSEARAARCLALGERFGYGAPYLAETLDHLVRPH